MNIKFKIIICLMLGLFLSGCDRYIESREPVRTLDEFTIVPMNLNVVIGSGQVH